MSLPALPGLVADDSKQRKEEQGAGLDGADLLAVIRGQPNRRFGRQPNERSEAGALSQDTVTGLVRHGGGINVRVLPSEAATV